MHVGVADACFFIPCVRAVVFVKAVVGIASVGPLGGIEPTLPDIVVAHLTVGVSQLQHIHNLFYRCEPLLLAHKPTEGSGVEESEAVVLAELLRTVVGPIVLGEVSAGIVVGGTESPVFAIVGEFAAPGVLLTVEHAHRRDVVVAELVAPEELRLIEQIALGEPVVHIAARCRPLDAFLKVEVGVAFLRLLPHGGSRVGIDPLELCLVIEVVDASSGLYKRVVPRHQRTGLQTFQEETQVLLQREVGVDAGGGGLLHARDGQVHNGVGSALRVGGVVTPRAVGVTGHESVVRRTVSGLPQLRLAKRPRGHAPRALFHAVGTEDVGLQRSGVGEPEVKVGAHVDAVEPITGLIAAVVVPPAEHVTLVQKVDRGEIFHKLRTAGDVHIGVVGHGRLSEYHILPVYIRIALGLFQIGRVTVFTDNVHRSHLEPRLGLEAQFVSCGLVADGEGIGAAHRTGELRHRFKRHVHSYFYLGLAFLSAFGGDENHAVGTLHTIDGRGRRVFQY